MISDHSSQAVAAQLVILSAGGIKDPADMPGIAAMTANLLTQGTAKRSALDIAQAIDFVGGSLGASAGKDSTTVTLNVVKKDLQTGMDLMSDVVLHPAFQADELDRQRQQLLSTLQVQYSDPDYLASAVFSRVVYGVSPYGSPEDGTRRLTRNSLAIRWRIFTMRITRPIKLCSLLRGTLRPMKHLPSPKSITAPGRNGTSRRRRPLMPR